MNDQSPRGVRATTETTEITATVMWPWVVLLKVEPQRFMNEPRKKENVVARVKTSRFTFL